MPASRSDAHDPALAAIGADASTVCARRLTRIAGIHALVLDGISLPEPLVEGVACWTILERDTSGAGWRGPLRMDVHELPFGDESFCAVLVRFAEHAAVTPEDLAPELARVLANHGTLLISGLHPRSLWRAGLAPRRWERALRAAGLDVAPAIRCGSPWPRTRGAAGIPKWLVRGMGGAYVIEAHGRTITAIPLRKSASSRRTVDQKAFLPGAHRKSLHGLLRSATSGLRAPRRFSRTRA
ncbi:MAG: class I SAM-dependent methyltransferase [Rhodanobacteraceae bacterium]